MPVAACRGSLMPHAGERGEHLGRPLQGGALHVVEDGADAAELLAAAGAAGTAVHEVRHGRAVAGGGAHVVAVEEEQASVERGDAREQGRRDGGIAGRDARHERAAAEGDEVACLVERVVRQHARDGSERLDLVHCGRR